MLPAVDVGKSVSRVGGKAQRAAYRAVTGDLKLAYAQFEELETFARFGTRLDEDTRRIIAHGQRIRACLKQPEFAPVTVPAQMAILLALSHHLFDPVPLERMAEAEQAVYAAAADASGRAVRPLRKQRKAGRCRSRPDPRAGPPGAGWLQRYRQSQSRSGQRQQRPVQH